MKIKSFIVNEFGILNKQSVHSLPSGLSIFLGQNEAGKSTCLEFFRTMLTGFPSPRTKKAKEGIFTHKNPKMGGILELETDQADFLRLSRTPQSIQLFNGEGTPLSPNVLDSLLYGISRDVYSSIYGFSLNELQALDSLESEEVKNALYGTFFGLGLYSPQGAISRIDDILNGKSSKVKSESVKSLFKRTCTELDEIEEKIQELIKENEKFDTLVTEGQELQNTLTQVKEERNQLQAELFQMETKIHAWEQWKEWYVINQEIERIPPLPNSFPQDIEKKYNLLIEQRNAAEKNKTQTLEKIDFICKEKDLKATNQNFVEQIPLIQELVEQKANFRNSLQILPQLKSDIERTNQQLNRQLAHLGSDWNMARVHSIDCSVFVHSSIEEHAQAIQLAQNTLQQIQNSLIHLNQEKQLLEEDIYTQRQQSQVFVDPPVFVDMPTRELLRASMQRVQDAEIKLPERKRHHNAARAEYSRSLSHIKFRTSLSQEALLKLADSQEVSLRLADTILAQTKIAQDALAAYIEARKQVEEREAQIQAIEDQRKRNIPPERQKLQHKKQAFRRLSALCGKKNQEEEKLLELQENYDELYSTLPITTSNILLLLVGFFLLIAGSVLLASYFFFHVQSVDVSFIIDTPFIQENLSFLGNIPSSFNISSVVSFLFFLTGFVCVYQNLPTTNPDRKKKVKTLQQIATRKESCVRKLKAMDTEIDNYCKILEISPQYLNYIDELALSLDNEHEQLITDEKLKEDTSHLEKELAQKRSIFARAQQTQQAEDKAIQTLRRQWQEHFTDLQVYDIPSPEGAGAYFARVDQIRLAKQNLVQLEEEIKELENEKLKLKQFAVEHLGYLETDDPNTLVVRVMHILESCREADRQSEKKSMIIESIQQMEQKKKNLEKNITDKEQELSQQNLALESAQEKWREFLKNLNIGSQLSPETARTALSFVERCLGTENELIRLQDQQKNLETEMEKLILPLQEILEKLQIRPVTLPYSTTADWISTLDFLQSEAEKIKTELNEKQALSQQQKDLENLLREYQHELDTLFKEISDIILETQSVSEEDFLEKARNFEELRSLQKRKQYVEDTLKFAAKDQDLNLFLKEFENLELPVLKYQKELLEEKLHDIMGNEENLSAVFQKNQAQTALLENSTALSDLRQQKAMLEEENHKAFLHCMNYSAAQALIRSAKEKYEKEKQPELLRTASEIFSHITQGKWTNITTTFEENTLYINPNRGEPITADKLSQGTREQLYLSIRLAYIRNAAVYKEKLPVIMDDILVNFDTTRSTQTAKTLASFTPEHQILFFTCHPHIATILRENIPHSTLFTIKSGVISEKS